MSSMIDDLLNPLSLPDKTKQVALIQTHISFVFLADKFVYKVKKPVNFGFLDFTTLKKRHYYCHQEVKLNRRLSKGIYLDVLPITYDGKRYSLGREKGRVVEYAVKMKRMPDDLLMKPTFLRAELKNEHIKKIANKLAKFHSTARYSNIINTFGKPEKIRINTDENFFQTEKYIGITVQKKEHEALKRWTSNFYQSNRGLFLDRIRTKKIRDCHGDLHMEHICLTEDLTIFDCIEFNNRFRYTDCVSDIAFLMMDLEYHGGNTFSRLLWDCYREIAQEPDDDLLLTFYKVYRALVRGKVNSFQLDDTTIGTEKKQEATQTALRYFQLARSYIG